MKKYGCKRTSEVSLSLSPDLKGVYVILLTISLNRTGL